MTRTFSEGTLYSLGINVLVEDPINWFFFNNHTG